MKIDPKLKDFPTLNINEMHNFQGDLKTLSNENLQKLKQSIVKHGFSFVFTIWKGDKNYIIDGHQRKQALLSLQKEGEIIPEMPVYYITAKDKKEAGELLLQVNSRYGEFNLETTFFEELEITELIEFAIPEFEDFDFTPEFEGKTNEDEIPEDVKPICKTGDLWKLGEHRLLCGDATKENDVKKLMNGEKADMVYNDPPYGMFLNTDFSNMEGIGKGNKYKNIIGDRDDFKNDFILKTLDIFKYCKEIFMWGADYYAEIISKRNDGSWIVWDKMQGGEGVNDNYDKMFGSNFELCWSKYRHKRAIARVLWKGIFGLYNEPDKKRVHPNQKPVLLSNWFIEKFSKKNNIIVDLFGDSGSTLIASEKSNRKCYMMELDEKYCDVIIKRFEDFTEQKAIKL